MRFVIHLFRWFSVFSALRKRYLQNMFTSKPLSVIFFGCYFRGEIIIGGFVVKELSSDPPSCLVTYLTRVDLKGRFSLVPHVVCKSIFVKRVLYVCDLGRSPN